ncbi:MAG: glycosyltransferase family 1 protein [Candidatus Aminicenantes bacterium]|nr:glycosyltransferase family 1 protein [Candidatus Aminicenantes bacterium]
MKIAFIGTRGVPARYGGFETCAEELGRRLAARGHEVWVYSRSGYAPQKKREYCGMRVVILPELRIKFLETLVHSFLALLSSLRERFDVVSVFNTANSPLLLCPFIRKKKIILHTDGLEWKREKWGPVGRKYHRLAERLAAKLKVALVTDSRSIGAYFKKSYGRDSHYISYGATVESGRDSRLLDGLGLRPGLYFLQVTRFEPENNCHLTLRAFRDLKTDRRLVLVGGAAYSTKYVRDLRRFRDDLILFPGFIYDRNMLRELYANCCAYIHGNEVGGTNPALLQAMGAGAFVIARDVPFNREVLGEAGIYFARNPGDLAEKMAWALDNADAAARMKSRAQDIIRRRYDWDKVATLYEDLCKALAAG